MIMCSVLAVRASHFHHRFSLRSRGKHTVFPSVKAISHCFSLPVSNSLSLPPRLSIICPKGHKKKTLNLSPCIFTGLQISLLWDRSNTHCVLYSSLLNMAHRTFVIMATVSISQGCGMIMVGPDMRATDQALMLSIKSTDCQWKSTSRVESVLFRIRLILQTIIVTLQLHCTNSWHLLGMSQKEWWEEKIVFGRWKKKETVPIWI